MELRRAKTGARVASALLALVALLALAACATTATTSSGGRPTFAGPVTPVAGCAAKAHTDEADQSPGRPIARCDPGSPAPQPLAQRTKVVVTAQSKGEYYAPVLVGLAKGEFAKENLDVQLSIVSFADSLPQLASGGIDIAMGGPYASVVNAVNSGFDIRWVLGNFEPPHGGDVGTPQSGLWFRRDAFTDPAHPSMATLKTHTPVVANTQGSGTPAALWLQRAFQAGGIDYSAVQFQSLAPSDQVAALRSGAVQGAFLVDPYWRQLAGDPSFVQLAVQPKEVNGGMFYGPNLLDKHTDVGLAFARAYLRTINTYLAGNYKADSSVMTALAAQMGVGVDVAERGDPLVFDWEVPAGLYTDLQNIYIKTGTVPNLTAPLPEDKLVSRDFYERAVGYVPS